VNRILELTQKRAALYDEAAALVAKAESEKRALTDDENTSIEATRAEMASISRSITTEQSLAAVRPEAPVASDHRSPAQVHDNAQDKPWESFGHFLRAVAEVSTKGTVDVRLAAQRAASGQNETVSSDGGFLVGTDVAGELVKRTYASSVLASRCKHLPVSPNSNGLKMYGVNETSRASGSRWGGITSYWASEAGTLTASQMKFRQIELTLKKLTGLCYATDELLQDTTALQGVIQEAFPQEFAFVIDDAILRGSGAGQPLGIFNSNCLVTQAAEGSQTNTTINMANITKMWSRMWAPSRTNAVWFVNQDIESQLYQLTSAATSSATPVFLPAGGLSASPFSSLMGRSIIPIEQAATLGAVGDIILADFSQYLMIDKGGVQTAQSIHVRFLNDEQVFRFIVRLDGQPLWNAALTPFKGSNTQSPFVVLAGRP
jgi:HK97 family phage major capsid protein